MSSNGWFSIFPQMQTSALDVTDTMQRGVRSDVGSMGDVSCVSGVGMCMYGVSVLD